MTPSVTSRWSLNPTRARSKLPMTMMARSSRSSGDFPLRTQRPQVTPPEGPAQRHMSLSSTSEVQ